MAQTLNTHVTSTVTYDAADILVARLNELKGIAFVRDAWENKAPDDYGVVELAGETGNLWADDKQIAQVFGLKVHLYVAGGGDEWVAKVQTKLEDACDGYRMPTHEYAYDINRNHWEWDCQIIGPLQWEEEVNNGQV